MLVDSHAHLTDSKLAPEAEDVVARARSAGVGWLVTIASDLEDSRAAIAVAERFPEVYATVGIHPHAAASASARVAEEIRELASHPRAVAIGETGLDFYYDNSPRDVQISLFRTHLQVASELDLPVVVHAREADRETTDSIVEIGWRRGVLHCFSGGSELLEAALSLDWYVSFAGMITFPRWEGADLLRRVPLSRLLVETDSPYLAPVPVRGQRNEPANVRYVAARAAELRGEPEDVVAEATSRNAGAFYRIPA